MIYASGASRLEPSKFTVNDTDISMSSPSTCEIHINGKLDVDLSGGSKVYFNGQPAFGNIELSGGSTINNDAGD